MLMSPITTTIVTPVSVISMIMKCGVVKHLTHFLALDAGQESQRRWPVRRLKIENALRERVIPAPPVVRRVRSPFPRQRKEAPALTAPKGYVRPLWAALMLGMSLPTVYDRMRQGRLPWVQRGRSRWISRDDVEALRQERAIGIGRAS